MNPYISEAARRRRTASGHAPELPDGLLGPFGERWAAAGAGAVDPYSITSTVLDQLYPSGADAIRSAKAAHPDAAMAGGVMSPLSLLPGMAAAKGGAMVAGAARANPTATGGLLGGLMALAPSATAADDDGLTAAQRSELAALKQQISGSDFKGKNSRDRNAERDTATKRIQALEGLQAEFSRMQNKAASEERSTRARGDAEMKIARDKSDQEISTGKVLEADAVRRDRLDKADKPFAQQFPLWNKVQPFVPLALGAATTAPFLARAANAERRAVNTWRDTTKVGLDATNPTELAAASRLASSYKDQIAGRPKSGLSDYAMPAAVGGIEGAVAANLPEAYNAMLPAANPERGAYEEYIKRLPASAGPEIGRAQGLLSSLPKTMPERDAAFDHFGSSNFLKRMAVGGLEGAGGAAFSTTLAKGIKPPAASYPMAETAALEGRLTGTNLSQASRAIGAEGEAMRTVLPKAPPRQQLEAEPLPPRQPAPGLMDLPPRAQVPAKVTPTVNPVAAYHAGHDPIQTQMNRLKNGAYSVPAIGAGAGAAQDEMPDIARLKMMVSIGLLPPSVLAGLP